MTGAVLEGAMGPQSQKINKVELKKVYIKGLVIVKVCRPLSVLHAILTPLPRQVTKGKANISIYSLPEFQEWKHKTKNFAT